MEVEVALAKVHPEKIHLLRTVAGLHVRQRNETGEGIAEHTGFRKIPHVRPFFVALAENKVVCFRSGKRRMVKVHFGYRVVIVFIAVPVAAAAVVVEIAHQPAGDHFTCNEGIIAGRHEFQDVGMAC